MRNISAGGMQCNTDDIHCGQYNPNLQYPPPRHPHAYIHIVYNRVVNDGNSISETRTSESLHG